MKHRAVFFDKDGTLIENIPYNVNPDLIKLNAGAKETAQSLKTAGFKLFIVSNQSGIARGLFSENDLEAVWLRINELCGIEFDGFYFCPHHPNGKIEKYRTSCDCRKPAPEMILQAAREHQIDLQNSWLIGDAPSDIEAGQRAGVKTILLGDDNTDLSPNFTVQQLKSVAQIILDT